MKRRTIVLACCLLVTIGVVATLVLTNLDGPKEQEVAYTNISRNTKICVTSTSAETAATIWHAVQTASVHEPVNAQQIIAPTNQPDQLEPFVNGPLALHCRLIIASGSEMHAPITSIANANPHQEFAIDSDLINLTNVHRINDIAEIPTLVHGAATR